jgi:hypothetical protein
MVHQIGLLRYCDSIRSIIDNEAKYNVIAILEWRISKMQSNSWDFTRNEVICLVSNTG